jgi:hypothetical protein
MNLQCGPTDQTPHASPKKIDTSDDDRRQPEPDVMQVGMTGEPLSDRFQVYETANQLTKALIAAASVGGSLGMKFPGLDGFLWGLWTAEVRTEPLRTFRLIDGLRREPVKAIYPDTLLLRPRVERGSEFPEPDHSTNINELEAAGSHEAIPPLLAALGSLECLSTVLAAKIKYNRVIYLRGLRPQARYVSRRNKHFIAVELTSSEGMPALSEVVSMLAVTN